MCDFHNLRFNTADGLSFGIGDRASAMKNGKLVGAVDVDSVTDDDLIRMIILGKYPYQKEV